MILTRTVALVLLLLPCAAGRAHAADTSKEHVLPKNAAGAVMLQPIDTRLKLKEARLPEATVQTLRKIASRKPAPATPGTTTLVWFAGPGQEAKSRAAAALATETGAPLCRVDLSAVVSKYIGETEKNLARVFDAAESSGAILLFDEADALFGKRTEPKDAHDRYANQEVSYLLARIEKHQGLVIIASNNAEELDPAVARRLQHSIVFPKDDDDKSG